MLQEGHFELALERWEHRCCERTFQAIGMVVRRKEAGKCEVFLMISSSGVWQVLSKLQRHYINISSYYYGGHDYFLLECANLDSRHMLCFVWMKGEFLNHSSNWNTHFTHIYIGGLDPCHSYFYMLKSLTV